MPGDFDDWWTEEDQRHHWQQEIMRRMCQPVIVEVPRRAGVVEHLEYELHRLAEVVRAATSA